MRRTLKRDKLLKETTGASRKEFNIQEHEVCIHDVDTITPFQYLNPLNIDEYGNYILTKRILTMKIELSDFEYDYDLKFNVAMIDDVENNVENPPIYGIGFSLVKDTNIDTNSYKVRCYCYDPNGDRIQFEIENTPLENLTFNDPTLIFGAYEFSGSKSPKPLVTIDCSKKMQITLNNIPYALERIFGDHNLKNVYKIREYSIEKTMHESCSK